MIMNGGNGDVTKYTELSGGCIRESDGKYDEDLWSENIPDLNEI